MNAGDALHRQEAQIFSRYLIGADPTPEMIDRYIRAQATLFGGSEGASDRALCEFARRHPWSLPFLDTASLLVPQALLRKKLIVMAAILEASPEFADMFLSKPVTPLYLRLRLMAIGMKSAFKFLLGLPILLIARWTTR